MKDDTAQPQMTSIPITLLREHRLAARERLLLFGDRRILIEVILHSATILTIKVTSSKKTSEQTKA
jgi:hypothetical protein